LQPLPHELQHNEQGGADGKRKQEQHGPYDRQPPLDEGAVDEGDRVPRASRDCEPQGQAERGEQEELGGVEEVLRVAQGIEKNRSTASEKRKTTARPMKLDTCRRNGYPCIRGQYTAAGNVQDRSGQAAQQPWAMTAISSISKRWRT
jgi:hypothetical protein